MKIGEKYIYDGIGQPENDVLSTGEIVVLRNYGGDRDGFKDRVFCVKENGQPVCVRKSLLTPVKKQQKQQPNEGLAFVAHRVQLCQQDNFYGSLTIMFENGKVVRTQTTRSEVPS